MTGQGTTKRRRSGKELDPEGRKEGIMRRWPILRSKQAGKVLLMSPWRHSLPERSLDWNEGTDF
jgi:hypothetical protein